MRDEDPVSIHSILQNFSEFIESNHFYLQRKFLATLTKEIADETLDEGSRQMACLIYKNFISNKNKVSRSFNLV